MIEERDDQRINEIAMGEIEFFDVEDGDASGKLRPDFDSEDLSDLVKNFESALRGEFGNRFDVRFPGPRRATSIKTIKDLENLLRGLVVEHIPEEPE